MAYDEEIIELETIRGGKRTYPEGDHFFVTVGDEDMQERVVLWSRDSATLAKALRRAADEIEGVRTSPFDLPPVLETLEEYTARTEAERLTCMNCGSRDYIVMGLAPAGFCSAECASAAHAAIVNPHDWRM